MNRLEHQGKRVGDFAKSAVVAACCVALVMPDAAAFPAALSAHVAPLSQQQKALHTLNRFSFGPLPGDEQAIAKMGIDAWFQRQLHPEAIDDSALEARLDAYPALKLTQEQLIRRFPSPLMIRQMSKRDAPLPSDPVERAIYADAMAAYDLRIKQAAAGKTPAAPGQQNEAMMTDAGSMADMQESGAAASQGAMNGSGNSAMDSTAGPKGKGKGNKKLDVTPMQPEDVDAVLALPPDQRIAKLVAMSPDEMMSFRAGVKPRQRLLLARGLSPAQLEIVGAMQAPVRVVGAEALQARLLRDVYSQRQLQAVMTDFWLNHFNVYAKKNQNEPYFLASYERDTILPNALGKFEDLLVATAKSPAMLMYLDNWQSIGPDSLAAQRVKRFGKFAPKAQITQFLPKGINENYARELMELHTLGVNGGYTQKDVIEVAKCFTGWTIDRPYQGGGYNFEPNRHEGGSKVVLGKTIAEGGESEGRAVLHMLATSPATAHFVSAKLAVRFVSDTPPAALVDRMAATFLKTDGDIKAVLTTMFRAPEFWAPEAYRAKLKTPLEFMTSSLRASNADVKNALPLVAAMDQLGMPLYGMQTPNGYSWLADGWASSNALVSRMNFAVVLSGSRIPGTQTDWASLAGASGETDATPATEHRLEALILGQPAAERTRTTVLQQSTNPTVQQDAQRNFAMRASDDENQPDNATLMKRVGAKRSGNASTLLGAGVPESPVDTMAGLLLGSPDFQRR